MAEADQIERIDWPAIRAVVAKPDTNAAAILADHRELPDAEIARLNKRRAAALRKQGKPEDFL
jgi:hypothetical protein